MQGQAVTGIFDRLLGRKQAVTGTNEPASEQALPEQAPSPAKPAEPVDDPGATAEMETPAEISQSFVCREPVLDRRQGIAGYQFSLPEDVELRLQTDFEFLQRIYDDAILRNLTSLGKSALLGPRLAFVRLSANSLDIPRIRELPKENTVLMLTPVRPPFEAERIQRQLNVLRQEGYSHGWLLRHSHLSQFPQLTDLAANADYAQVDASGFDGMDLRLLVKELSSKRTPGLPKQHLIAGCLNAVDEFHSYFQANFDYFLGQFVTRRENWHPPKSNVNRLQIIKLLNLLRGDAEIVVIAEEFKHDPVLAFRLLRYINSPLTGLRAPVVSMDKALMLLGREKIYRWLSLLLFDFKTTGFEARVIAEQALSRANFLENLAAQGTMPAQADSLFILGLFSLLDQLMGQSMADLLVQTKLPKAVHDALLGQTGPYSNALLLAIAAEGQSPQELERLAMLCGLEAHQVSQCAMQSLAWAHQIAST